MKKHNIFKLNFNFAIFILLPLWLTACTGSSTSSTAGISGGVISDLTNSSYKITTNNAYADGNSLNAISITLKDKNDKPAVGFQPEITVDGEGVIVIPCTKSNTDGESICQIKSTVPGIKTISFVFNGIDADKLPNIPSFQIAFVATGSSNTTPTTAPGAPTNTPVPPTNTPGPGTPTTTPVPPTNTPVPPTNTPGPGTPTNTPIPPTNTPVPLTSTPTSTPTLTPTPLPSVQFSQTTLNVSDDVGTVLLTLQLSRSSAVAVDVNFSSTTGILTPVNYSLNPTSTVHFNAGVTSQTITATVISDNGLSEKRDFTVSLNSATGASVGVNKDAVVNVYYNIPVPQVFAGEFVPMTGQKLLTTPSGYKVQQSIGTMLGPLTFSLPSGYKVINGAQGRLLE